MGVTNMGSARGAKNKRLYRHEWEDTSNPLVTEARMQTLALQRLQVWLRLLYSVLAVAVLACYWGCFEASSPLAVVAGAVVGALALVGVIVLRTGISRGRQNVNAMLESLQAESQTES